MAEPVSQLHYAPEKFIPVDSYPESRSGLVSSEPHVQEHYIA